MTWDFALGVAVGLVASAGVWVGIGYERLRLAVANRSEAKPVAVKPDPAPVSA